MNTFLLLFLAIVSEVVATSALRASEGFSKLGPSLLVAAGYGVAFYLLSLVLKQMPIGTAYALWAGLGTALVAIVSVVLFRDPFNGWQGLGIALIVGGVVVLNLFGNAHG